MTLDDLGRQLDHDRTTTTQTKRVSLNFEKFASETSENVANDLSEASLLLHDEESYSASETTVLPDTDGRGDADHNKENNDSMIDKSFLHESHASFSSFSSMDHSLYPTLRSDVGFGAGEPSRPRLPPRTSSADTTAQWTRAQGASLPWLSQKQQTAMDIDPLDADQRLWDRAEEEGLARRQQRREGDENPSQDMDGLEEPFGYIDKAEPDLSARPDTPPQAPPPLQRATQTSPVPSMDSAPSTEDADNCDDEDTQILKYLDDRFKFSINVPRWQALQIIDHHLCKIRPRHQWSAIRTLDISRQNLVRLSNLDSLFPCLETLVISDNALRHVSGLPKSLQVLKAKSNKLTDIEGFKDLQQLQYLDICNNAIDTFEGIGPFVHLRTLHAENNKIASCGSFRQMRGLVVLNLRGNMIRRLRFGSTVTMDYLETLDLSYNRIECLDSIEGLTNIRLLNLDHNDIKWIHLESPCERLKILRMSFNRLRSFDGSVFPDLRTLYLDDNQILRVIGLSCIPRLDSFSLRDQVGQKVELTMQYLRGTRKLYFSGNSLKHLNNVIDFFALEYLELCSVQLEELPADFSRHVPNLGTLYLSHNYLQDITPLRHLRHLQKLVLIDNRLQSISNTLEALRHITGLHYLDLRQNHMTLKFYPPLNLSENYRYSSSGDRLSPYLAHEHDTSWMAKDAEFCRTLPDQYQQRRAVYRAVFINGCAKLMTLDGIDISDDERTQVDRITADLRNKRP